MNVLKQIIEAKKRQVEMEIKQTPLSFWEKEPAFQRVTFSLKSSLSDPSKTGIIAEFKRRSPSKGVINESVPVAHITSSYTEKGASGLSILTDTLFFGGSIQDLKDARFNALPILRKDFVIDEYQVIQSKAIGADVILLIAACLTPARVKQLAKLANQLQLEVLLEVHDEKELEHLCEEIQLVGVNNRDLKTFTVNVQRSLDLAPLIRKKWKAISGNEGMLISESGISKVETIDKLRNAGYQGFLMGEHFMKQKNPSAAFADFVQEMQSFNKANSR